MAHHECQAYRCACGEPFETQIDAEIHVLATISAYDDPHRLPEHHIVDR